MNKTLHDVERSALLVVDIQESFRHRPYWTDEELPAFLSATQRLIDACKGAGIPIAQIFHTEAQGAFALESGYVRTLDGLSIEPDVVFYKRRHSALSGTELAPWLTRRGITRLVVCGIRTEQCCETTTRHASELGFEVDFASDATLTFPMTHPLTQQTYTASEIKARTELVLAGRFARVASSREIAGELLAAR